MRLLIDQSDQIQREAHGNESDMCHVPSLTRAYLTPREHAPDSLTIRSFQTGLSQNHTAPAYLR
jgi:hypothetical protein